VQKISKQTFSFILLFSLAVLGSYLCLMLWSDLDNMPDYGFQDTYGVASNNTQATPATQTQQSVIPKVDTSTWKTYTDKNSGLSFKYKPTWKVLAPATKNGYTVIQIDPGSKFFNIKVYISPKDYYVMTGLPTKPEIIGGQPALNVNDALYGIKDNGEYFTFDVGYSMSLLPDFNALVHSVAFAK
jgi:hypothetical protein